MIISKILDVSLELLERTKVFQDRKADRLQARADRKRAKANSLERRGKWKRSERLDAKVSALELRVQRLLAE